MSKYLNPGPSRYSKPNLADQHKTAATDAADTLTVREPATGRNASGYTARDEQLFDELLGQARTSRSQPVIIARQATYQTPYSANDARLFKQLHPGSRTRRQDAGPE